eukprot:6511978-Prymnesium_polylepis.2
MEGEPTRFDDTAAHAAALSHTFVATGLYQLLSLVNSDSEAPSTQCVGQGQGPTELVRVDCLVQPRRHLTQYMRVRLPSIWPEDRLRQQRLIRRVQDAHPLRRRSGRTRSVREPAQRRDFNVAGQVPAQPGGRGVDPGEHLLHRPGLLPSVRSLARRVVILQDKAPEAAPSQRAHALHGILVVVLIHQRAGGLHTEQALPVIAQHLRDVREVAARQIQIVGRIDPSLALPAPPWRQRVGQRVEGDDAGGGSRAPKHVCGHAGVDSRLDDRRGLHMRGHKPHGQ